MPKGRKELKSYRFETSRENAYRIRILKDGLTPSDISVTLDCLTVYDGENDIQIFEAEGTDLTWQVIASDAGADVVVEGVVVVSDEDAKRIDSVESIDYAIDLSVGDDCLEPDEDYGLIENYNVQLKSA